ncbi:MAG: hypothetical protein AB7E52_08600 [Bdellovibrionales bacterium]
MKILPQRTLCLGILLVALAGCGHHSDDADRVFPYVRLSPSAPPQTPFEIPPRSSYPMYQVWRTGYWDYDGLTFTWVPGHFINRPDPTASWTPDRWEQRSFGWAFVPGFWQ